MKVCRLEFVAVAILTQTLAFAQQPVNNQSFSFSLAFEKGRISNSVYENECFGFSLPIPAGWQLHNPSDSVEVQAQHTSPASLVLLALDKMADGGFVSKMAVNAYESKAFAPSVEQFVANAVQGQIGTDPEHREASKDASIVEYAGKSFSRSGYKQTRSGESLYIGFVYTKFRDFYVSLTVMAKTVEQIKESENSLQQVSFGDDNPNPKCVMREANFGAIGSGRAHLSKEDARGLLIKPTQPDYPEIARRARVQGHVLLHGTIDKNGDVRDLTLISGHPMLAPSAIKGVRQWKYKPYLLDGQPVEVETEIDVIFSLAGG